MHRAPINFPALFEAKQADSPGDIPLQAAENLDVAGLRKINQHPRNFWVAGNFVQRRRQFAGELFDIRSNHQPEWNGSFLPANWKKCGGPPLQVATEVIRHREPQSSKCFLSRCRAIEPSDVAVVTRINIHWSDLDSNGLVEQLATKIFGAYFQVIQSGHADEVG